MSYSVKERETTGRIKEIRSCIEIKYKTQDEKIRKQFKILSLRGNEEEWKGKNKQENTNSKVKRKKQEIKQQEGKRKQAKNTDGENKNPKMAGTKRQRKGGVGRGQPTGKY